MTVTLTTLGQVNSWTTNQGPQQWDQTGSVDYQSGQFPHGTMPQDQQRQFQNGTVLYGMIVLYAVVISLRRRYHAVA